MTTQDDEDVLPCAEKITFETRDAAEATAITSYYWYGKKPRSYQCRFCGYWHLSTGS